MGKLGAKSTFIAIICLLLFALPSRVAASELEFSAEAVIAFDANSGKIFYDKNSHEPLPIASMTKMLTFYLILEAEKEGLISWDDQVEPSERVLALSTDFLLANVPFAKGESYSVRELYQTGVLASANASVIALAEHLAGSEKAFVERMRKKVESWGITDAYLISASGLNNEDMGDYTYPGSKPHDENLMSAKSLALVAQHLVTDYPEYLETAKQPSLLYGGGTEHESVIHNSNLMLPGLAAYKAGVDGLKTGTTELAGHCFAGTISADGQRLITIVMGIPYGYDVRFAETAQLMDYVLEHWQYQTFYHAGETFAPQASLPVKGGKQLEVPVILSADVAFWVEADQAQSELSSQVYWTEEAFPDSLTAPLQQNETLVSLELRYMGDSLGYLTTSPQAQTLLIPLQANAEVKKANFFVVVGRQLKSFWQHLF